MTGPDSGGASKKRYLASQYSVPYLRPISSQGSSFRGQGQPGCFPSHPKTVFLASSLEGHSLSASFTHTAGVRPFCTRSKIQLRVFPSQAELTLCPDQERCQECGEHCLAALGSTAVGESLFFGKGSIRLSLVMPMKWRGSDQFTQTFQGMKERMDPDSNLFSFIIAYLCLQLASQNGVGTPATATGSHSLFIYTWRNKALAGTGYNGSGGAQGLYDFKKRFQILLSPLPTHNQFSQSLPYCPPSYLKQHKFIQSHFIQTKT